MNLGLHDKMWIAQEGKCFYCRRVMLFEIGARLSKGARAHLIASRDHLFPRRMTRHAGKKVWACKLCNSKKGDRQPTLQEYARFHCLRKSAEQIAA